MRPVGERHHRATIPDAVVRELRDLYEYRKVRCRELVELFAKRGIVLRYRTVRKIVAYQRRLSCPSPQ